MKSSYNLNKLKGKDIFEIMNEHKAEIDDYFWKYYENVTTKKMEEYIRVVLNYVNLSGKVLSIGCGHGLNEIVMVDMCDDIESILGIDIVEFKINSMNEIIDILSCENIEGIVGDGMKLDFPSESFDCVVIIESLSHVDDQHQVLKEAVRVLKRDGTIFLMDFNNGANIRIWFRSWKLKKFEDTIENIVNPYFVKNRLADMGFSDIIIKPYRHYRSFGYLRSMFLSRGVELPPIFYLLVSKGFMLKGKKQ